MTPLDRLGDAAWLNDVLAAGGRWAHGPIEVGQIERIGEGYGLSGVIYRVRGRAVAGDDVTLVAKTEDAARTVRATAAHGHVEAALGRSIPVCFGSVVGPPAVDLATLLSSFAFPERPAFTPDELLGEYASASAHQGGVQPGRRALTASAAGALVVLLRGAVGWVGQPSNAGFHDRKARLRDDSIGRVLRALDWLDGPDSWQPRAAAGRIANATTPRRGANGPCGAPDDRE